MRTKGEQKLSARFSRKKTTKMLSVCWQKMASIVPAAKGVREPKWRANAMPISYPKLFQAGES